MRKKITAKEFREQGYLQEVNRQVLHPLGLALSVIREADGSERFGDVLDAREDEEGFIFLPQAVDADFHEKALKIDRELFAKRSARRRMFGWSIQPGVAEIARCRCSDCSVDKTSPGAECPSLINYLSSERVDTWRFHSGAALVLSELVASGAHGLGLARDIIRSNGLQIDPENFEGIQRERLRLAFGKVG